MFRKHSAQPDPFSFITLFVLCVVLLSAFYLSSCNNKKVAASMEDAYYTCSMHPQINEPKPGKCPICQMDLIRVQKSTAPKSDELQLNEQQIQLGNIKVDTIGKAVIGNESVLTATLNYDQRKLTSVSSKLMGRIDKLYHKNVGEYIRKGDRLMELYSEELNNAKQEYVLALERRKVLDNSLIDFEQVIRSARTKLALWGMTVAQIDALTTSKSAKLTTTVYSNRSGYITEVSAQEGAYVAEGETIVQLADLSTLWAEAQVYTSQYAQINRGGAVLVRLPDIGREITGKLEFVNPEISPDQRVNLVRVTIPNVGNNLRPGMSAYVILKGGQRNVLSLPLDAVIRGADGATVWLQTGKNTFKNRMVTVGMESGDRIEITQGLQAGEAVVTSGAYLINSEYIFQRGATPMAGMKM